MQRLRQSEDVHKDAGNGSNTCVRHANMYLGLALSCVLFVSEVGSQRVEEQQSASKRKA